MNPTLLLFSDEENASMGSLEYDLVEAGLICEQDDMKAIVVSEVVNACETEWKGSEIDRELYLAVEPKVVNEVDNVISIVDEVD